MYGTYNQSTIISEMMLSHKLLHVLYTYTVCKLLAAEQIHTYSKCIQYVLLHVQINDDQQSYNRVISCYMRYVVYVYERVISSFK